MSEGRGERVRGERRGRNPSTLLVGMQTGKQYRISSKKLKMEMPFDPVFFFIVVQVQFSAFSPHLSPPPQPSTPPSSISSPPCYCLYVLYNCSCKLFTLFSLYPLPSPLWSLSACSQFQCLWLYFACLFLISAWLFTQPSFLTRLETIQVRACHDSTLLLSAGVTWFPIFSGNDLAGVRSPSG